MAWTDYSSTAPSAWTPGSNSTTTKLTCDPTDLSTFDTVTINGVASPINPNTVFDFIAVPGWNDGYLPAGIPSPIANNIDQGGGGGSVRPSSGFLYPRGDA